MINLRLIEADGHVHNITALPGVTLMTAAVEHRVPGILAECGGFCACATCHVFVPPEWLTKLPPPDTMEAGMLTGAIRPDPSSRLACQITLTPALDGLIVRMPENQI
jgi:ferredoxin, 2Fe-2S